MGAGRQTRTYYVGDRAQRSSQSGSINCNVTARNLTKKDLGAVIFGCTHDTMKECLANLIFGLPNSHFSYIKKVEPGMPLFLFNYSDRKLHGVFEATSHGKLNINPYGWSTNNEEKTQYPAQVRVRIREHCRPLSEKQYKPIIDDNYHSEGYFWFELDHHQTKALLALYVSSPMMVHRNMPKQVLPNQIAHHMEPVLPQKNTCNWISLFKNGSEASNKGECNQPATSNDIENSSSEWSDKPVDDGSTCSWRNLFKNENGASNEGGFDCMAVPCKNVVVFQNEKRCGINKLQVLGPDKAENILVPSITDGIPLEDEPQTLSVYLEKNDDGWMSEPGIDEPSDLQSQVDQLRQEIAELKASSLQQFRKTNAMEVKLAESDTHVQLFKGLVEQLRSQLSSSAPCISESLKELHANPSLRELFNEPRQESINELVFLMGGFDGNSWLSALDCYSPSRDVIKSLKPMSSIRSYASSATLYGEIYICGGGDGTSWSDTVDSYNLLRNEWTSRPSLNKKKGNLAVATLHNKIFAIGGGDGAQSFSDMEMFDPILGRWIHTQSMLYERFALAAAELNGVIYAVGGYDGSSYLKSAERYDPRQASWSRLQNMGTKRGSHTLTVLNEKLYAIGGYDGNQMVSSVEMFDPRIGSWIAVEEMKQPRGCSVAAVIGESIYLLGGMCKGNALDMVERYKEGQGWEATYLKSVGKRCFSTAVVLDKL